MRFRLFQYTLPADPMLPDLNAFLGGHRVASVSRHVVSEGGAPLLVFVVETVGSPQERREQVPAASARIDYRESLSPEEFAAFSRLRTERKSVADAEGVPVYTVFTNAQLADMVRRRMTTPSRLAELDGVGKARVDKYAARFAAILANAFGSAGSGELP